MPAYRRVRRKISQTLAPWEIAINDGRIYQTATWAEMLPKMRKEALELKDEGRRICSHFERMMREYDDWEDRFIALNNAVEKMEGDTGIPARAILQEVAVPQYSSTAKSALDEIMGLDAPVFTPDVKLKPKAPKPDIWGDIFD